MKINIRYMFIIIVLILISYVILNKIIVYENHVFDSGKDTVESWGNGEYQLLRDSNKISLFNCQYHECMLPIVDKWNKKDNCVYIIGKFPISFDDIAIVKIKINLSNNIIYYYSENILFEDLNIVYANSMIENEKLKIIDNYDYFTNSEKEIFINLSKDMVRKSNKAKLEYIVQSYHQFLLYLCT